MIKLVGAALFFGRIKTSSMEGIMFIVVDSLTGLSMKFASHLPYPVYRIGHDDIPFEKGEYFLVTRSFNFGEIPISTIEVLRKHYQNCIGVAVSGNKNWGANYGAAGDKIQQIYGIEFVHKFEGTGFPQDVEVVEKYLRERGRNHE